MTGDDHGNGGTAGRFDQFERRQPGRLLGRRLGVRPRHLLHLPEHADHGRAGRRLSSRRASRSALHVDDRTAPTGRHAHARRLLHRPARRSSRANVPESSRARRPTARTASSGATAATQPKVELAHGIRLDTNYYYWPGSWIQDRPGLFTGSGMPMRFADPDGSMIDVYQATTQMTDESGQTYPVHDRHAARQRARPARATTASSRPTCTPTAPRARAPTRSSPRRRRAACRSSPPQQMLQLARRTQRLVVQRAVVERQQARLHHRRRCRRERPAGDGADGLGRRQR